MRCLLQENLGSLALRGPRLWPTTVAVHMHSNANAGDLDGADGGAFTQQVVFKFKIVGGVDGVGQFNLPTLEAPSRACRPWSAQAALRTC